MFLGQETRRWYPGVFLGSFHDFPGETRNDTQSVTVLFWIKLFYFLLV